jgi:cytochrome c-type biogenesis protein CcmH
MGTTAASAASPARDDPAIDRRMIALTRELRCLVCQNETLADSQAGLAEDLRREIRGMIAAGRSDREIVDFLVARYGDFIRYRPPVAPRTWLLWAGPGVAALGGLGALLLVVRRRQRVAADAAPLTADDHARAAALFAEDDR